MNTVSLTGAQHARAILRLGVPLVGGHLAQFAIGLTDSVMLGWYGVAELAAVTLAGSLFFTVFMLGSGFAWAVLPMVADYAARGKTRELRRATRMALWLSALYFALAFPVLWFSGAVLKVLGQSPELAQMSQDYLRIAGIGLLPALGMATLRSYLSGIEHARVVFWVPVSAALANGLANYALIFGNWGAPELGLKGAAIASVLTGAVGLLLMAAYSVLVIPEHRLFQRIWRPDPEMFMRVFRLGWPIGLTALAEVILFATSSIMIGWIGTLHLAAHGAALQICSATFMIQVGLSNVATVRVGNALAREDGPHLRKGARVLLLLGLIGVIASVSAFLGLPEHLLGLFIDADEPQRPLVLSIGTELLMIAALFQLVDAAQVLHLGLLRGLQDTRVPMIMAGVSYLLIGLPAAYVLGFAARLGAVGVWLGLVLGLLSAALLLALRFWQQANRPLRPSS